MQPAYPRICAPAARRFSATDARAASTAFLVANNASTTEFAVLDNGNATLAGNLIQNSDQRLKTNIQSLDASSSIAAIKALNPVSFNWVDPAKGSIPQYGFIAQQVQAIFPNLVSTTSPTALTPDGTLSLNYIDLIAPIVKAIQQLDQEVSTLETTMASLAQSITSAVGNFGQVNSNVDNTQKLCIGQACVTGIQLAALLANANTGAAAPAAGANAGARDAPNTPSGGATTIAVTSSPVIQINGDNPATVEVGATYNDLGATIIAPQADLNLGLRTFLNGQLVSTIQLDTTRAGTDTIDYVAADSQGLAATSTRTVIVEASSASGSAVNSADASTPNNQSQLASEPSDNAGVATSSSATTTSQ